HPRWQQHLVAPGPQDVQLQGPLARGLGGDPARTAAPPPQSPPRGQVGDSPEHRTLRVEEGEQVPARGVELLGRAVVELHPRAAPTERLPPARNPPREPPPPGGSSRNDSRRPNGVDRERTSRDSARYAEKGCRHRTQVNR